MSPLRKRDTINPAGKTTAQGLAMARDAIKDALAGLTEEEEMRRLQGEVRQRIGKSLARARRLLHMTKADLGARAKVHAASISKLESDAAQKNPPVWSEPAVRRLIAALMQAVDRRQGDT